MTYSYTGKLDTKWLATILLVILSNVISFEAIAKDASQILDIASKSTVIVQGYADKGITFGSGIMIPNGSIITNCHVIKNATRITVKHGTQEYDASRLYSDKGRDICSLTSKDLQVPPVVLGNTGSLKIGNRVYAITIPRKLNMIISEGTISGLRHIEGHKYIQMAASIPQDSAGGGLYDEYGILIGLTAWYSAAGQNLNFAVPVEWINELPARNSTVSIPVEIARANWNNKKNELMTKKDWPELIAHSERWILTNTNGASEWCAMGIGYLQLGKFPHAIECLKKALQTNYLYANAWSNLSIAYLKSGDISQAIASSQKAVNIDASSAFNWINLAAAFSASGKNDRAIESLQKALSIQPKNATAWYNLGVSYIETSNGLSKAIESLKKAVAIDPQYAHAWANLGWAYGEIKDYSSSIECHRKALDIDPNNAEYWSGLGSVYSESNNIAKAIECYMKSLNIDPDNANTWSRLGFAYVKSDDIMRAIESYQKSVSINPKKDSVWLNLGSICIGQYTAQAIKYLQKALDINPKNDMAWMNLGHAYGELGDNIRAIECLQKSLDLNSKRALAWYSLGKFKKKANQNDQIKDIYRRLQMLDPNLAQDFYKSIMNP